MPGIDRRLLSKGFTNTPKALTRAIKDLCAEINSAANPVWVPCRQEHDADPGECFFNVARKVERDGGEPVNGWVIWEWPIAFIEAEHHAVWSTGGDLHDITPHYPPTDKILFLPDPHAHFDFATLRRRLNIKRSLGIVREVQSYLEATDAFQEYLEANSSGKIIKVDRIVATRLQQRCEQAMGAVLLGLASRLGRNDPCFCSSGRRYKRCCAPLIYP